MPPASSGVAAAGRSRGRSGRRGGRGGRRLVVVELGRRRILRDSEGGGESGEGDESDDGDENDERNEDCGEDDGLSDYERLRLRNIRRNEARLARLGLLSGTAPSSISAADDGGVAGGASRGSDSASVGGKKRKRMKEKVAIGKQQSLPPRRNTLEQRRDMDSPSDSSGS